MRRSRWLIAVTLMVAAVFLPTSKARAVQGIGVTPAIQEVTVTEGQEAAEFTISLSNYTEDSVELQLSVLDFGALDESGGIAFLGRTEQETTDYGLRQWMMPAESRISLDPGSSKDVKVVIRNDASLRPGGHYGAVVISAAQDETSADELAVVPAASTLVLLKKVGGENYKLDLQDINTNKSLINLPRSAVLRFHNAGNVHVVPRGTLTLSGPTGSVVANGYINETSSFVLPESDRVLEASLTTFSQPWLPGRYTLTTVWRYDGTDQTSTTIQHYWYLGKIGIYGIVALCMVFVLYLYISYRRRAPVRS